MKVDFNKGNFSFLLFLITILVYLFYLIPANIDLSEGRFHLYMDEQISFDGVTHILHPKSKIAFVKAIIGDDQRYGRLIYNLSAAVAFLPEKIWGATGQIIAARMLLFVLLAASYLSLVKTFIRNNIFQLLAFIVLLCIPSTAYYSTMPKPEPFLLFFFSLFLYYHKKNNYGFGWYFLWLGVAFGCKISLLFPVCYLFLLSAIYSYKKGQVLELLKNFSGGVAAFCMGLFCSVPILLGSFIKRGYFKIYFDNTFLNTKHGTDDSRVTFFTWIHEIITNWIHAAPALVIISITLLSIVISYGLYYIHKNGNTQLYRTDLFTVLMVALLFILPIILLTKRIWFFYLHPGVVFAILTFFVSSEYLIGAKEKIRNSVFAAVSFLLFFSLDFPFAQQKAELAMLSKRTSTPEYLIQKKRYDHYKEVLENEKFQKPGEIVSAFIDPILFSYTNPRFSLTPYWGYFQDWSQGRDFVIFHDKSPKDIKPPLKTNYEYEQWKVAVTEYERHVGDSAISPKYTLISKEIEGLFIYKRVN